MQFGMGRGEFVEMNMGKLMVLDDPASAVSVTAYDANHALVICSFNSSTDYLLVSNSYSVFVVIFLELLFTGIVEYHLGCFFSRNWIVRIAACHIGFLRLLQVCLTTILLRLLGF